MTEELEVIPATRSPHGYLASFLSDNIAEKEDGTLIVVGCPIARTGWQKYAVKDLPLERAKALGVDVSNPEASIDLYRPPSEVFHPEFLASLNGCPITDGHPPNGEFVDPDNFNKYAKGHIQNVRKGPEPLGDGDWPVVADLVISAEPLISKVKNRIAREVSLGYDFSIDRDGDKIIQCSMLGNHNAVVPKGRAGDYVRIEDAAPGAAELTTSLPTEHPASTVATTPTYPPIAISFKSNKEKHPVSTKNKLLRLFMGKHLIEMARATDADPEKIMEAAEALQEEPVADKRARDGELPPELEENKFKASDRRGKSRDAMHAALDRMLDGEEELEEEPVADRRGHAKDVDIDALKALLNEFLSEESEEPEHAAEDLEPELKAAADDLEEVIAGEAEDEEACPDCGEVGDACECEDEEDAPGEELVESGEEVMDDDDEEDVEPAADRGKARDRARAADGASAVLRMLRPVVARTGDKAVQSAFNRALDSVKKSSRASTGGYGAFASSARARDRAPRNPNPERSRASDAGSVKSDPISAMQKFYDTAHKGGK